MEFYHSLLKRADARGSADVIYRTWRMSLPCRSGIQAYVTKKATHRIFKTNEQYYNAWL